LKPVLETPNVDEENGSCAEDDSAYDEFESARGVSLRCAGYFLDGTGVPVFFQNYCFDEMNQEIARKDDEKSLAKGYRQSKLEHDRHEISGKQQEISAMQNAQANPAAVLVLNASIVISELLGKHQDEEIYAQCEIV
jgi:hypothetical protein